MADRITKIVLRGDVKGLQGSMTAANRSMQTLRGEIRQVGSTSARSRGQLSGLLKLAAGSTAALGLGKLVTESVKLEAAYSKTMAQVAVATQAPAASLERLDDLAMKLGADTVFSAQDAAAAMLELAKGGLSTAEIEAGSLADTLTLASAGGLELGDAANVVVQAMGAFRLEANQTDEAVAALAGGANASSADVSDMTQALAQAGTTSNSVGLSIQDTTAYLALFADQGFKGSDAGTSLRTMLSRLVPQTEQARKTMEALGLTYTDANGQIVSAEEIAARTQAAFKGLTDEQRIAAVNSIFGMDAQRAVNAITAEGVEGFREYKEATSDLTQAQQLADAANSGTAGAMEQLSGAVETAKIQLGKGLAPAIQNVAGDIANLLENGDVEGWAEGAGRYVQNLIEDLTPLAESGMELGREVFPVMAEAGGLVVDVLTLAADVITPLLDGFNKLPDAAQQAIILAAGAQQLSKRLGPVDGLASRAGESVLLFGGNAEKGGDKAKKADRKFAGLASTLKGMAVLTLAGFALPEVSERLGEIADNFEVARDRSGDWADSMDRDGRSTADTVQAISDALGDGAVGKHAADLGVDMEALADGLAKSGGESAAVRDILRELDDLSNGGFMDGLKSGLAAPFGGTELDKAERMKAAIEDLVAELDEAHEKAARTGESLNDLAIDLLFADGNTRGLAAQLKAMPPEVKTAVLTPGAIESVKDVRKLAETYKLTPDQVTTVMQALDFATKDIDKVVSEMEKADKKKARPKVTADTSEARLQIRFAEDALDRLGGSEAEVFVNANTRKALADAYAARARIDGLTASIYVTATGPGLHVSKGGRGGTTTASAQGGAIPRAAGGEIVGPGTGTSDSIPAIGPGNGAYLLSNGEHVWTAEEVDIVGGQEAMYAMREAVRNQKHAMAYAGGGGVGRAQHTAAPVYELAGATARLVGPDLVQFITGTVRTVNSADAGYSAASQNAGGR